MKFIIKNICILLTLLFLSTIVFSNCTRENFNENNFIQEKVYGIYDIIIDSCYIIYSNPPPPSKNDAHKEKSIDSVFEKTNLAVINSTTIANSFNSGTKLNIPHLFLEKHLPEDKTNELIINSVNLEIQSQIEDSLLKNKIPVVIIDFAQPVKDKRYDKYASSEYISQKYPSSNGLINFSRVIFDDSLTYAICYYEIICGVKCGIGKWLLLKSESNSWRILNEYTEWLF